MNTYIRSQLVLHESDVNYLIDFESSFQGVNDSSFIGIGLNSIPIAGELDSDAWMIKGCSEGDTQFASSYFSGDFARGQSNGNVTTGGIYAFSTSESNIALGWQSTTSDMSPGSIVLKITNQSGFTIERIAISYQTWILNDQNRSQQLEFSYSIDNNTFFPLPLSVLQSDLIAANSPTWSDSLFTFNLDLPEIANEQDFYLQWKITDLSGSGSRDEWAIDNITFQITNNTCLYEAFAITSTTQSLYSNEGFTLLGVDSYYDSPSNYGLHSPSARFDDDQDQIVTTSIPNPFSLKFWMKSLGSSTGSSLLLEGFDGSSWITLENYQSLPGTGTIFSIGNLSSYTQFRFTYSKVNGNLAIDDIRISCGSCIASTEPPPPTGQLSFSSTYCNQSTISWPIQDAEYYLVLATEKASIGSIPLDQNNYQDNPSMGAGEMIEDSVYVVYNGSANQFTLNQLKSGSDYLIHVFPYKGLVCEENYTPISLSSTLTTPLCTDCPYLISALINPCAENCIQEGLNELLFFNSASFSFLTDTSEFKIYYKGSSNNLLNQNMQANPSLVNGLNNLLDCPTLFIDATVPATIPNNSIVLLCNSSICLNDIDKSILCSLPLVYVLSCESSEWNPNGEFLNSGYGSQQFILDFSNVSTSCILNYSYIPNDIPQVDGSFIQFSQQGGSMISHSIEANCNSTIIPLPLLWGDFTIKSTIEGRKLEWSTLSENDNLGFSIERADNSTIFSSIGWIGSKGNSITGFDYFYLDMEDINGIFYYRLKQTDYNGISTTSPTISIEHFQPISISQRLKTLVIEGEISDINLISIYSIDAQHIESYTLSTNKDLISLNLDDIKSGIYIIQFTGLKKSIIKRFYWR